MTFCLCKCAAVGKRVLIFTCQHPPPLNSEECCISWKSCCFFSLDVVGLCRTVMVLIDIRCILQVNGHILSHLRLMNTENSMLQARDEDGVTYERTLVASEFTDWLLQEGETDTREETEQLGRRLLEHGIIQHGKHTARIPSYTWGPKSKGDSLARVGTLSWRVNPQL